MARAMPPAPRCAHCVVPKTALFLAGLWQPTAAANNPPQITLQGANPQIVAVNDQWSNFGALCNDVEDGQLATVHDADPAAITDVVGIVNVTYTCTDSMGASATVVRTVVIRGIPVVELIGPSPIWVPDGGQYSEPGACCAAYDGGAATLTVMQRIESSIPYKCQDSYGAVSVKSRLVITDNKPRLNLLGMSATTTLQGAAYTDAGALCTDIEQGELRRYKANKLEVLPIVSASRHDGNRTFSVYDGETTARCADDETWKELTWVRLDLGTIRTVRRVEATGVVPGFRVHVSSEATVDVSTMASCQTVVSPGAGGATKMSVVNCKAPIAGRYVFIHVGGTSFDLAEVRVWGTAGPEPPASFDLLTTCSGRSGEYIISGTSQGQPKYSHFDVASGQWVPTTTISFDNAAEVWVLKQAADEVELSRTATAQLVKSSWPAGPCGGASTRVVTKADGCPWLFGPGGGTSAQYECMDGRYCAGDGCCGAVDVARCPPSKPQMCVGTTNGAHVCAPDCASFGGLLECGVSDRGAVECYEDSRRWDDVLPESEVPAQDEVACQAYCRGFPGCAHWNFNKGTANCTLSGQAASVTTDAAYVSGPRTCLPRLVVTGQVNTTVFGDQWLFFSCIDMLGQRAGLTRTVKVSCEGPNPLGVNGGNKVECDQVDTIAGTGSASACLSKCLDAGDCEAYEFNSGVCRHLRICDGKYYRDDSASRQVGYCKRKDHPPRIEFTTQRECCSPVGWAVAIDVVRCSDSEDGVDPAPSYSTNENVNTPGVYNRTWTCKDSVGQVATLTRPVTYKATCNTSFIADQVGANIGSPTCSTGTATVRHGDVCEVQCKSGNYPTFAKIACVTDNDLDYQSRWDPAIFNAIKCGGQPCIAPQVANTNRENGRSKSCRDAGWNGSAYVFPSASECKPNCLDGRVPSVNSLSCVEGTLIPSAYICLQTAGAPPYVSATALYSEVNVKWERGVEGDCAGQFDRWELNIQRRDCVSPDSCVLMADWANVSGCTNLLSRTTTECKATGLQEASTYKFRVRQVCTSTNLNSPWTTSADVTTKVVKAPGVLFSFESWTTDQFYVLFNTSGLEVNADPAIEIKVERTGEFCGYQGDNKWDVWPDFVRNATAVRAEIGAEVAHMFDSIIITLPAGFISKGCRYDLVLAEWLLKTQEGPPFKGTPRVEQNFTYVDVPPALMYATPIGNLTVGQDPREVVQFKVRWSLPTVFQCIARPRDQPACDSLRTSVSAMAVKPATISRMCNSVAGPADRLQASTDPNTAEVTYVHTGLYPGVPYTLACDGIKLDAGVRKPWVSAIVPDSVLPSLEFATEADMENGFKEINLTVISVCTIGNVTSPEIIRKDKTANGASVQFLEFRSACRNGGELQAGDTVYVVATATLKSPHSTLTWAKQRLSFAFDPAKPVLNDTIQFRICALAYYIGGNPTGACQTYELSVYASDVQLDWGKVRFGGNGSELVERVPMFQVRFAGYDSEIDLGIDGSSPHSRRLSVEPAHWLVPVGVQAHLPVFVAKEGVNLNDVQLFLGSVEDFELPTTYNAATKELDFELFGQGTNLQLLLVWSSAKWTVDYTFSFRPPDIHMDFWRPKICCSPNHQTILKIELTGVPDIMTVKARGIEPRLTTTGYNYPERYMDIWVGKRGTTRNLCSPATFPKVVTNSGTFPQWTSPQCVLSPAALTDIVVMLQIYNASLQSPIKELARLPVVADKVSFVEPYISKGAQIIDVGQLDNRSITLAGDNLPQLRHMVLENAELNGYRLDLEVSGQPPVSLCDQIDANDNSITCRIRSCLNVSALHERPELRLRLGDLRMPVAQVGIISLPRPEVTRFTPVDAWDVGPQTFEFWGKNFGTLACEEGSESVSLVGDATGVRISIGVTGAHCKVVQQNSSYVKCAVNLPIAAARVFAEDGGVPQVQRSMSQMVEFRVGQQLTALEPEGARPPLELKVALRTCPSGQRRMEEDSAECVPCARGRWVTTDEKEWPLRCNACPAGTYQDQTGATACLDCPENTETWPGAASLMDCVCKPGYYSPYYNATSGSSVPGTTCIACHGLDMTQAPAPDDNCGSEIAVSTLCDVHSKGTCINDGFPALNYRLCKAYCPGGTAWPRAKGTFWLLNNKETTLGDRGLMRYEPLFTRCDPPEACLPHNNCEKSYTSAGCGRCVWGYWQDSKTNRCNPCGSEQVFGLVVMSALVVTLSVGGLFGAAFYIRFRADIQFRHDVVVAVRTHIVEPVKSNTIIARFVTRRERRLTITLNLNEVGKSYNYAKHQDLGMVFRVDDRNIIHLAGLLPDSPMRGKAEVGWKLMTINGKRLDSRTEVEVQAALKVGKFPLRLTFLAPQKTRAQQEHESNEVGTQMDFTNDRKMIIIMIGVMNSFNQVSMFDFDWPPVFRQIAQLAAQLSFNLNFFHPECSVEVPFINRWMLFLSVPYMMMIPLTAAYFIASAATLRKDIKSPGEKFFTKAWLLKNAYARVCCMSAIILLPFHYDQLLVPFSCIDRGTGSTWVAQNPSTPCTLSDPTYVTMINISVIGTLIVATLYSGLLVCLWKSFTWQSGARIRNYIPFYVAMVEVSTFGQRGYIQEVRDRVMSNVVAVKVFNPNSRKLIDTEIAVRALDLLGERAKRVADKVKQGAHLFGKMAGVKVTGDDQQVSSNREIRERSEVLKAKTKFKRKQAWPDNPDGNLLTYGWILIVNLAIRQIASLMTIKLTKGNLVVIGAGFQMLIFAANASMLIIFNPYKANRITKTEATMITALFCILFCAVLKDLLTNHVNAHLFALIVGRVSVAIDFFAVFLLLLALIVPMWQLFVIATRILVLLGGSDVILNDIYMTQRMKAEREKNIAEKSKIRDLLDVDMDAPEEEDLAHILAMNLPTLDEVLHRYTEQGLARNPNEQFELKRQLMRLGRIVKTAQQAKQRRVDQQLAQELLEERQRQELKKQADIAEAREAAAQKATKDGDTVRWKGMKAMGALFGASKTDERPLREPLVGGEDGDLNSLGVGPERFKDAVATLKCIAEEDEIALEGEDGAEDDATSAPPETMAEAPTCATDIGGFDGASTRNKGGKRGKATPSRPAKKPTADDAQSPDSD